MFGVSEATLGIASSSRSSSITACRCAATHEETAVFRSGCSSPATNASSTISTRDMACTSELNQYTGGRHDRQCRFERRRDDVEAPVDRRRNEAHVFPVQHVDDLEETG